MPTTPLATEAPVEADPPMFEEVDHALADANVSTAVPATDEIEAASNPVDAVPLSDDIALGQLSNNIALNQDEAQDVDDDEDEVELIDTDAIQREATAPLSWRQRLLDLPGFRQVSDLSGLAEEEPTPPLRADEFEESKAAVVARLEKMLKRASDDKEEADRTDPEGR